MVDVRRAMVAGIEAVSGGRAERRNRAFPHIGRLRAGRSIGGSVLSLKPVSGGSGHRDPSYTPRCTSLHKFASRPASHISPLLAAWCMHVGLLHA